MNDDKNRLICEFPKDQPPSLNDEFVFKDEFDQPCYATVIKVTNTALLETTDCKISKNLKGGEKFEKLEGPPPQLQAAAVSPPPPEPQIVQPTQPTEAPKAETKETKSAERRVRGAFYLYYSGADTLKFDSARYSTATASDTGSLEYKMDTAMGVAAEIFQSEPYSWGWSLGIQRDFTRDMKSETHKLTSGTVTATYIGSKPTLTFTNLYVNAVYRWEHFYLPFGLNYTLASTITLGEGASGNVSMSGTWGAQLGVGVAINESFSLELLSRALGVTHKGSTASLQLDAGTGFLAGVQLHTKISF